MLTRMAVPGDTLAHGISGDADGDAAAALGDLTPDALAAVGRHLRDVDVGNLMLSCRGVRRALEDNDALFADMWRARWPGQPPPPGLAAQAGGGATAAAAPARALSPAAAAGGSEHSQISAEGQRQWQHLGTHHRSATWAAQYKTCALAARQYRTASPSAAQGCKAGGGEPVTLLTPSLEPHPHTWVHVVAGGDMWVHPHGEPRKVCELVGSTARVEACVPLARGMWATAGADKLIRLWSLQRGAADRGCQQELGPGGERFSVEFVIPAKTLRGHSEGVTCLHVLPNYGGSGSSGDDALSSSSSSSSSSSFAANAAAGGTTPQGGTTLLASGGRDRTVRLWGLHPLLPSSSAGGRPLLSTLRGHGAAVSALAHDPARPGVLVSGGRDARAKLWDLSAGCCVHTAKLGDAASRLAFHPATRRYVVAAGACIHLIDPRAPPAAAKPFVQLPGSSGSVLSMAATAGLLVAGARGGATVWDFRGGTGSGGTPKDSKPSSSSSSAGGGGSAPPLYRLHRRRRAEIGSVHADSCRIVTGDAAPSEGDRSAAASSWATAGDGGGGGGDSYEGDGPLRVWDPRTGRLLATMPSALPRDRPPGRGGSAAGGSTTGSNVVAPGADEGLQREHMNAGITALACFGSALVAGTSSGNVVCWDHKNGGPPLPCPGDADEDDDGGEGGSKFWESPAATASRDWRDGYSDDDDGGDSDGGSGSSSGDED